MVILGHREPGLHDPRITGFQNIKLLFLKTVPGRPRKPCSSVGDRELVERDTVWRKYTLPIALIANKDLSLTYFFGAPNADLGDLEQLGGMFFSFVK